MTDNILDTLAKSLPPPDELDELMARDPLEYTNADIDKIIAYQRQMRARKESGGPKPKRGVDPNAPKVTLDLAALGLAPAKPEATVAKPGTMRRL